MVIKLEGAVGIKFILYISHVLKLRLREREQYDQGHPEF